MQWLKGKLDGADKQNFMVGSDKWTGHSHNNPPVAPQGSFKNPGSADSAVQASDAQPNPSVEHASAPAASAANDGSSVQNAPAENSSKPGMYPNVNDNAGQGGSNEDEEEVLTGTQTLVTIPGAFVHLIDDEESVHLGTGEFSLVRFVQQKTNNVVVVAKVGEDLKWPLVHEMSTVKLDPTHYFFSLQVPKEDDDNSSSKAGTDAAATEMDTLNYGVTFPAGLADEQAPLIRELDYFLERYSMFSAPTIVQGDGQESSKESEALEKLPKDTDMAAKAVSVETVSGNGTMAVDEETSAAFWTTVAPNVDHYNHRIAKGIASGTGNVIKGIFWLSDSAVSQLNSGHDYMKSKFKPKAKKSEIRPVTMGSVRQVRKVSSMTDKVANGVLGGILYTTGLVSSAVINSPPGRVFFRTLPGEVVLVSLDAFGSVFDAIEKAGTNVMVRSSSVTQDFVDYRYGESAKQLTGESFRVAGHAAATAWTLAKIQKAFTPTNMGKAVGKGAVTANKKAQAQKLSQAQKVSEAATPEAIAQ